MIRPPEWNRFPHSFSHIFAADMRRAITAISGRRLLSADAFAAFGRGRSGAGDRFRREV